MRATQKIILALVPLFLTPTLFANSDSETMSTTAVASYFQLGRILEDVATLSTDVAEESAAIQTAAKEVKTQLEAAKTAAKEVVSNLEHVEAQTFAFVKLTSRKTTAKLSLQRLQLILIQSNKLTDTRKELISKIVLALTSEGRAETDADASSTSEQ